MNIQLNTFAAACYDQNSVTELEAALAAGPDKTDMDTWNISAIEWREQISLALAVMHQEAS